MESDIKQKLIDKGLSENSIKLYLSILKNLNDKREILDFKFLSNPKKILDKIKNYKITTQRNIIISIVSVLKNLGNDLYKQYYNIMIDLNKKIEENLKLNEKTETQDKNWISWKDVEAKFNELKSKNKYPKNISESQYYNLLDTVILGLFVLINPRRNKDYLHMKFSKDGKNLDDKFNYLDMKKKQFVFNNYKTKKTYGQQIIDVPNELFQLIKKFIKYNKNSDNFLLAKFNGDRLANDNSLTRQLNKIFNKNISSSMLRHIFLSDKYGKVIADQEQTAKDMGHSVAMQKEYIKK